MKKDILEKTLIGLPDVLTVEEAAAFLQVSPLTVRRRINSKQLKSIRVGKAFRIPKPYLSEYMTNCQN